MPEEMADGGRKLVTLDDLIDALDKRERAPSNVPKVETFHFKGDRVSDWLDLTEQALVGLSNEVKLQRVLRYVLHSHHREVTKVVDAAGGSWAKFGDLMRRKYRLGDGLLTMTDLKAMTKEDFSTIGAFVHEFKKRARKVHGISEEAQCATVLGLLTGSEATELTKYGEGSERLTWATIDKGVEEGSLDQVEQHQMRLQRRKRKERDATASGTPGVKKIVTDVLAALGYDSEAELQKRVVAVAQGRGSGVGDEEAGREDYGRGETGSQALTKAQRKHCNLLLGGQGSGKGQAPQVLAAPPPVATAAPAPAPAGSSHMGPPPSCGHWVPHCQSTPWPSCNHCALCGGIQAHPGHMVPYSGPSASMGPPSYPATQSQPVTQPSSSQQASQASVAGGGGQGQGGQGNGVRGQGGRGGGGRGRGGNGGGRGGGWNGQGGQNQGGQGGQGGGQGYGRPRFDWRSATCWHCGEVVHTVRFCQQQRDDEKAGLISTCMDGDIYDRWGTHIDPKTPGGIRQETLRRAAAGPLAAPTMFRIWQERQDPGVRVKEIVDGNEEVTQRPKAGTIKEEPIVVESDDEAQEVVRESASTILERMEDLLAKVDRYQERLRAMCEKAREWEMSLPAVMLYGSGPGSSSGPQGCLSVATAGTGPRSGMTFRPPTSHGRAPQVAQTRGQSKATASQGPSQAPSRAPPRKEPEPERRKEVVEVQEEENEGDDEEDEKLRQEEDRRAEQRAKKRGAKGGMEPSLHDGVPKRKKYAVRLEEGFDVERMVDKLLEGHNDLMNLKDILASAPRLRGELKGRLSRRDQPSIAMVDTGVEMNIIRERDTTMLGLEVNHSDHGVLHGANCKAIFCGTASNVMVEIGRVRARTCFFIMPDVDHPILLGRSFLCRMETLVFNRHEGTMILALSDPACGNYEILKCRNTGPGSGRNRLNLGSFTFEESEYARRRLREEQEEEGAGEVLSLSLNDVNKAMEVVAAHDMADLEAIKATLRWVQDLQRLNAVMVRDAGGLPNVDAVSESCAGRPIISLIDLYSGYDQFPVYPPDRPVTAMHTPRGLIHMSVAPQGWTNAVAMVQRHMIRVMQTVSPHITQPYIDDLAVKGPKEKEEDEVMPGVRRFVWKHVQDIDQVLGLLEEHKLTASGPKSKHCMREATILGFVCNEKGRRPDVKKTDKILEWPVPFQSITNVRSFLGTCGFWRSFVKDFATKTEHLRKLVRQDQEWVWGEDQERVVERMKREFKEGGSHAEGREGHMATPGAPGDGGRGEQHEPHRREPTLEFDDDNIELFLDVYRKHVAQRGWSVAERIHHLRGIGWFEEPVAQICKEALTWPDVEAGMQRLRASPRGRDGMLIRLEEGNADEFIPAYEHYMLSLRVAQGEWVQALLIWTRRAKKQVVKQIQERARDWEDCQAQLRRAFGRSQHERHEPRVERRRRSKRPREPALSEAELARGGRGAPAQREDEPVEPALTRESFPACGLRAVEFRRITSEELRPPSPLPSTQELDIPRETSLRSLATHLDVSQWEASRLGEGSVEPACYVPLAEPLDLEMETDMRDREEPQDPEMVAERSYPVRPRGREVITVGDDTPPCSPAPEPAQRSWPEGILEPGSEEIPEFPPEATTIPEQEAEAENQGVCERARMEAPLDLPSATQATKSPDIEEAVSADLPPVVLRASTGMEAEASTPGDQGPRMGGTPRETREEKSAQVRVRLDEIYARQAEMEATGIEPTPSIEPKTSEQRIDKLWARYESQRDAARQRSREAGQADEETSELREMGDLGFSATRQAIERMDRRVCETSVTSFQWYNLLSNEFRVKELEVEHLTTQLAEERARSRAREVEWERRFGEMAAAVGRLSAAWEASQMGRASADSQGRGVQASSGQEVAVEVPRQAEPMEEAPLDAVEEESGTQESLMAMSTERRGSRLHEVAAAMGIGTPHEGPQGLDAPEHAPRLGELRAELGSWATGTDSRGPNSRRQQQQEVMSEPAAIGGSQPSGVCRDEAMMTERAHEEGPRELDTPERGPGSAAARRGGGVEAMKPKPQGHGGLPSCHEVTSETMGTPSASSSQGRKKKTARWHDTSCFWCKEEGHRAMDCPELLEDKAEGRVAKFNGKCYDRQGRIVERAPDGGRAQLYRQNQEELCK
ncbi:hypothetical protein CBR_g23135 [Chara braunii]|uniref:CCHC-type domain-containing protein n=1 Tax=Chara braunii TaxID=69332 RepID=A0A388L3N8_CHABU|nr:hypothetical protein CBR_g23135 [Chara braunii]|eukprot:GBG76921.1 hypothetical protein CBR_g23135 [Chara braunii]